MLVELAYAIKNTKMGRRMGQITLHMNSKKKKIAP